MRKKVSLLCLGSPLLMNRGDAGRHVMFEISLKARHEHPDSLIHNKQRRKGECLR